MQARGPIRTTVRFATIATLIFPLLALDCSDSSGPDVPGDEPPPITGLPGSYTADMTFQSRTGGAGGCPYDGHRFDRLVLHADPVAGTVTIQFTFPVTGPYDPSTGAYAGVGRGDSSAEGFEIELMIDGVFSRDSDSESEIVLVGSAIIRQVPIAGGAEFCRTRLALRMENTGP